jgi:hypothetical protein
MRIDFRGIIIPTDRLTAGLIRASGMGLQSA